MEGERGRELLDGVRTAVKCLLAATTQKIEVRMKCEIWNVCLLEGRICILGGFQDSFVKVYLFSNSLSPQQRVEEEDVFYDNCKEIDHFCLVMESVFLFGLKVISPFQLKFGSSPSQNRFISLDSPSFLMI